MPSPLKLRRASEADARLVADIHILSRATTYRDQLPDHYLEVVMPLETCTFWPQRMTDIAASDGIVFIAENQEGPIGFICVEYPDANSSANIDNLHVLPANKGQGAGSLLLAQAQAWARTKGARQLHLQVLDSNEAAIRFYESKGWQFAVEQPARIGDSAVIMLRYEFLF